MSLPVTTAAQMPFTDNSVSSAKMGVPKSFVGRGTYEGLGAASTVVQQSGNGQTGKGLRESMSARTSGLSAATRLARTNALVSQAGLPAGLNKAVDRPTADVLAVRMQRQDFMRATVR